jgi:hypothetical protein
VKRLGYSLIFVGLVGIILGWGTCLHQPSQDMTSGNYIEPSNHFYGRNIFGFIVISGSVLTICAGEYIRGLGKKKK